MRSSQAEEDKNDVGRITSYFGRGFVMEDEKGPSSYLEESLQVRCAARHGDDL